MRQKIASIAHNLRLPSICTLCNQCHKGSLAVCAFCIALMDPLGPSCQHCAYPLPDTQHPICGSCIKNPLQFDRTFIPYRYEEPLRGLLHQFKYHKALYLASLLSHLMLQAYPSMNPEKPQCLIPVPMHPKKLRQRGFNQSVLLAQLLAKKLHIPYDYTSCRKLINTPPQASLDKTPRQNNVRGAFHATPMPYTHVILIDDLLTTGSTANELAGTLKKTGIKQVDVWCCARAVYA
ncbi:MAG: ComF family protein [Legionellales bacterium]